MNRKFRKIAMTAAGLLLLPAWLQAQTEKRPAELMKADRAELATLKKTAKGGLAAHLERMSRSADLKKASNAARVARDLKDAQTGDFIFYSVPAASPTPYLPDSYPIDGEVQKTVGIISAQDEYEPGSFLIYALKDLGKVQLSLTEFKTKDGDVFPASALDLKFVKVWYQNRNAWTNYFGDTELALIPELLLNDEDLVIADEEKVQNYAKLQEADGTTRYVWITPPLEIDRRFDEYYRKNSTFMPMRRNFHDAKTLRPVNLPEGVFKQFFLTAHTAKDRKPGLYKGAVKLTDAAGKLIGQIPVSIRVLPFALPKPKTYADVTKDYLTAFYSYISIDLICQENGGDEQLAWEQLDAVIADLKAHNQTMHWIRGGTGPNNPEYRGMLELLKKHDMDLEYILGGSGTYKPTEAKLDAKLKKEWFQKNLGHNNVYLCIGDEPPAEHVMYQRPILKIYQDQGFKFIIAGREAVLFKAGYAYDFFNMASRPETRESNRRWNEIGHAHVAWYARHHVGPEDPCLNRRAYGLGAWLAGFSATCNYAHHFGPWNDRSTGYKPMVLAYGIGNGVVDTIQWEGYREGIDDIRYATLMKTLALEAEKSPDINVRYAGREALQYLALQIPGEYNPNAARLEMTQRILKLKELLKK